MLHNQYNEFILQRMFFNMQLQIKVDILTSNSFRYKQKCNILKTIELHNHHDIFQNFSVKGIRNKI